MVTEIVARLLIVTSCLAVMTASADGGSFYVLSYHDVAYEVRGNVDDAQATVSAANLAAQFQWLADHDFTPVSMERILRAARGGEPLPERAVLITFDDGYRSFHDIVLPLLELYRYPAVLALVTRWLEVPYGSNVAYGPGYRAREDFLDWEQIRTLHRSPLVEIASHSHDMHHGVIGNPQGNSQPAATTRIYEHGEYESQRDYLERVHGDIERSATIIERNTGQRPRVMVWPFGAHSNETIDLIEQSGMQAALTLEPGAAHVDQPFSIPRLYVSGNPDIGGFARLMYRYFDRPRIKRSVRISLDAIHGSDEAATERQLGALLDQVKELGINTAVVRAFHDADGDGVADAVYFPNRLLPTRSDLLNRVLWQLRTRAGIRWIYVWMPIEYGDLPESGVVGLFEDLGRHSHPTGLFFEAPRQAAGSTPGGGGSDRLQRLRNMRDAAATASSELRLAMGLQLSRSDITDATLRERITEWSTDTDDFFLVLGEDVTRRLPDHRTLGRFLEPARGDPGLISDFVFEIPVVHGNPASAVKAARGMLAAGAPGIGFRQQDLGVGASVVEALRGTISLRDHPHRP